MRTTRSRNVIAAAAIGALMAAVSPAIAHAESPKSADAAVKPVPLSSLPSILDSNDNRLGLRNWKSQKYLQPSGGSTANGARIVQQPKSMSGSDLSPAQNWIFVDAGDTPAGGKYYSFENVGSGKNMGIDGASTAAGAAAIQANGAGDLNQDWYFDSDGYPTAVAALKNRKSGLCLGISGASTANGAQAAQFRCDGSENQGWQLVNE